MTMKISERERERRTQSSEARRAFDITSFCHRYGLGRTRTYDEIKSGRLRVRKCGRKTLIAEDDAEQWLASLPSTLWNVDGGAP